MPAGAGDGAAESSLPDYFITAEEVSPTQHVDIQAVFDDHAEKLAAIFDIQVIDIIDKYEAAHSHAVIAFHFAVYIFR